MANKKPTAALKKNPMAKKKPTGAKKNPVLQKKPAAAKKNPAATKKPAAAKKNPAATKKPAGAEQQPAGMLNDDIPQIFAMTSHHGEDLWDGWCPESRPAMHHTNLTKFCHG